MRTASEQPAGGAVFAEWLREEEATQGMAFCPACKTWFRSKFPNWNYCETCVDAKVTPFPSATEQEAA